MQASLAMQESLAKLDRTDSLSTTSHDHERDEQPVNNQTPPRLRLKLSSKPSAPPLVPDITVDTPDDSQMDKEEVPENQEAMSKNEKSKRAWNSISSGFQWIPNNLTIPRLKPVVRSAVSAWISTVLFVIPKVEAIMGQASFLILITAFLSPPSDPFVAVMEREFTILLFVSTAYGWCCLGIKLASLARREFVMTASMNDIFSGRYIEALPTVICALFLFLGCSLLLYVRTRKGPGPFVFATVLGCTTLDISLTVAPLFPYPYYKIGKAIVIPIAFHSAVALTCSVLVFPETVNAQFGKRLRMIFVPLAKAIDQQSKLLSQSPNDADFDHEPFLELIAESEAALIPLAASGRLMKRDISWGRFGASDLTGLHEYARRLTVRANGMAFYFKIVDPKDKFPATPMSSRLETPLDSPAQSRAPSPTRISEEKPISKSTPSLASRRRRHHYPAHLFHHLHHYSPLHDALNRSQENAVGVFESQKYLNLESRFQHALDDAFIKRAVDSLRQSSTDLLLSSADALRYVVSWLERMNADRFWKLYGREREKRWGEAVHDSEETKERLAKTVREFREKKRHLILEPYRSVLDPQFRSSLDSEEAPPHRYLFQCYLYQYHLLYFALMLCDMLDEITRLEKTRHHSRLWLPTLPLKDLFSWKEYWEPSEDLQNDDDEDPDVIPGIDPETQDMLGMTSRRDPDALPPSNVLEALGNIVYSALASITHGNVVFALKAGMLTVILSLPAFLPSSAHFAYVNKFVWAIFMGQLTLCRFRGDTTFGLTSRILSTFLGGTVGMVLWYISAGSGRGSAFGLAAVGAVCFPFFFFARLYWPGPQMTNIIFFVTSQLVVGYSWQDTHLDILASQGWGFDVAWRRFVLVSAGVTAAFIFSFLPPSTTLRRYIRTTHATTVAELGQLYCDVVSYTGAQRTLGSVDDENVVRNLIAIRSKLARATILRTNVVYEFSLRGKWPTERYDKVQKIQMEIAYLLSHLRSVVEHLEPAWAKAFLRRTRFLEADFQGDVLAVISMISTALRAGAPLPQVTPCPLLDRFTLHHHGLNVLRREAEDDYGLPRTLTIETLENEQYLCFSVGVATAYGIVTRLDRLMLATKELVGEQYHIHGMGLSAARRASRSRRARKDSYRSPQDV